VKSHLFARLATAGTVAIAAFLVASLPAAAQVAVTVNGNQVNFNPEPIIQAGRVFVPLRGVFERLGASVVYSDGTINATGDGRNISLQIGSTQATIDGQPQTLDVAPFIVGASTYVPLRFVSEALGASVNWDDSDHVVSIDTQGAPQANNGPPSYAAPASYDYASVAPPPIPDYDQPYVPGPNYIWQPGYWAWGAYGYYWVPGTWVQAPQPGYLWTPGYWRYDNGGYAFNQGFWALTIGFYGGVNYGGGYFGNGYSGGRWEDGAFRYNTYVTHVNTTIVNNVYEDRTVYVNNTTNRISYNGGEHGLQLRPTPEEAAVATMPHIGLTPVQKEHLIVAAQDRRLLATVNHDKPPVLTVATPLKVDARPEGFEPVKPTDRLPTATIHTPAYREPVSTPDRAVPTYHAPVTPTYKAPTDTYHAPATPYHAPVTPAYKAPTDTYHAPATPYHAPVTPAYKAPTDTYHAPVTPYHAPVTPAYKAPPEHMGGPANMPVHTMTIHHTPPPPPPKKATPHTTPDHDRDNK
jgi:hypothetical protein